MLKISVPTVSPCRSYAKYYEVKLIANNYSRFVHSEIGDRERNTGRKDRRLALILHSTRLAYKRISHLKSIGSTVESD